MGKPRRKLPAEIADLLRERAYTVREIAEKLAINKPTAYMHVALLALHGQKILIFERRERPKGPEAKAYHIAA